LTDIQKLYRDFHRQVVDVEPPCVTQPESFYPEDFGAFEWEKANKYSETMRQAIKVAKALCAECPIRQQCLEYAVEANEEWGIWGGLTPRER
jgi:hypothetical protein